MKSARQLDKLRLTILIISIIALAFAFAVFSAGPGTRLGLWEFPTGLSLIFKPAKPLVPSIAFTGPIIFVAIASVLASMVALFWERGIFPLSLIATVSVVVAATIPLRMQRAIDANPFIHDVTTDFVSPPRILAAAEMPRSNPASYDGDQMVPGKNNQVTVAAAQQEAFPDIGPLLLEIELDSAIELARKVVTEMKMEVLSEEPVGGETAGDWRIEAVYTSSGFGFKDDFIVRLSAADDETVRIDVRSKSRVGKSDLGDNAARIREFLNRMKA